MKNLKGIIFYCIIIIISIFIIDYLKPLNFDYHLSNFKVKQFEIEKLIEKITDNK